jgi:hypothetical protein|tara:strand:- start:161 stop:526 length:366 start_codon:yes stop_codon:yes gene_type:complete
MNKYIILFSTVLFLGACSSLTPEPRVIVEERLVEKLPLNLEMPANVVWKDFEFIVVTPDNYDSVVEKLKSEGKSIALFAVDEDSYENLSLTVTDMKRYIGEQKIIIVEYKNYYEPENNQEE